MLNQTQNSKYQGQRQCMVQHSMYLLVFILLSTGNIAHFGLSRPLFYFIWARSQSYHRLTVSLYILLLHSLSVLASSKNFHLLHCSQFTNIPFSCYHTHEVHILWGCHKQIKQTHQFLFLLKMTLPHLAWVLLIWSSPPKWNGKAETDLLYFCPESH